MKQNKQFQRTHKKNYLIIGSIIIVAIATVAILEITNVTHIFHKKKVMQTASQNTKGELPTSSTSGSSTKSSTTSGNSSSSTTTPPSSDTSSGDQKGTGSSSTTTATLIDPTGDFVSNHHPNLSGSPAPNRISSVCTTTTGATCTISFTKDGVTKSLAAETTDQGGSAYWDWKLQDIGLTAGSWHISVSATLGSQTKTATDAMALEVSQ